MPFMKDKKGETEDLRLIFKRWIGLNICHKEVERRSTITALVLGINSKMGEREEVRGQDKIL